MATNSSAVIYRQANPYRSVWSSFIGWGVSTLLLWLLNRDHGDDSSTTQDPSDFTGGNANQIGSAIPVVMGRAMIKNPLISYYGDFQYRPYTEEYGMHTEFPWASIIPTIVLGILALASQPDQVIVYTSMGPATGQTVDSGAKRAAILNIIVAVLLEILLWLFTRHMGKTTIQKGFKYYLGWQHIICWTGEDIGLKKIWMNVYDAEVKESTYSGAWSADPDVAWKLANPDGLVAHIDNEDMFGGVDEGGGFVGDIRVYFGTNTQPLDSWMVNQMSNSPNIPQELRGLTPRYPMFLTCVIPTAYIGKQATIPEMWFEVVNYPYRLSRKVGKSRDAWSRINDDANPAEVIYEILKNPDWGCDYSDDRIDIDSLKELGNICVEEELGISCHINAVDKVSAYINKILNHINGTCYDDPKTGKLTFKLIRSDYNVNSLKRFDVTNCDNMEFNRLDWSETFSTVVASFTFADEGAKYDTGTVSVVDLANTRITHTINEINADATYFTTKDNARSFAKSQLLSAAYPLATVSFESSRYAYDLTLGQPILISWEPYGINRQVFRVTDIDYGTLLNGKISVTAVEDVFGFEKTEYGRLGTIGWEDYVEEPANIEVYTYLEYPYEMSRSLDTYVYAYAARPDQDTVKWYVYRYMNNNYSPTTSSTVWSMVGRLYYLMEESYIDDNVGFTVIPVGYDSFTAFNNRATLVQSNPTFYNNLSGQNLILIDKEILSYDTIESLGNGTFKLNGVIRGVFDTLPKEHYANSYVFFLNFGLSVTNSAYVCQRGYTQGELYELLTESQSVMQQFDPYRVDSYTTVRRSESPSVMADMYFGNDRGTETDYQHNFPVTDLFAGDIKFKFKPRNKFNTFSILHQYDNSVLVETDTVNVLSVTGDTNNTKEYIYDAYDQYNNLVEDITFKWEDFCYQLGNKLQEVNVVTLELFTKNSAKGINSYDKYVRTINYRTPVLLGIVSSTADVVTYATSLITGNFLTIPQSPYNATTVIDYSYCPIIFVGYVNNISTNVLHINGVRYDISSNVCYIVDGKDSSGNAIVRNIPINENFVFTSVFTSDTSPNVSYKYRGSSIGWELFNLY